MNSIDLSGQHSKGLDELRDILFDVVVTVCDKAEEACPVCSLSLSASVNVPATKETINRTFEDPAKEWVQRKINSTPLERFEMK